MNKKHLVFLIVSITFAGIFLRAYNFSDWLHFETDQVDDVLITEPAADNGLGDMALLGPKAGAKLLRLPSGFYNLEYLSAKIFGNTPPAHALPVLFFSCLAIPVFYIFSRQYFSRFISFLLLTPFSFSFYLVLYSRFSWNPNLLPFFMLFSLLALYKSITLPKEESGRWFLLLAASFGFASQLHYNALFILGAIILATLLIKRPYFNWKIWTVSAGIVLFLYFPFIVHEIKTGGYNTKLFFLKIDDGIIDETNKEGPPTKLIQNFRYGAGEFYLILTGDDRINKGHLKGNSLGLSCKSCRKDFPYRLAGYVFYSLGFSLLLYSFLKEKESARKNFLLINLLWFTFSFLYFWKLLINKLYIYPRFFLLVSPLPFLFWGLVLKNITIKKHKLTCAIGIILTVLIAWSNLTKLKDHYSALNNVPRTEYDIETEDIFPNTNRLTLSLQKEIVREIIERERENQPVYLLSDSEYEPVYWYFLNRIGIGYWKDLDMMIRQGYLFREGSYFIIARTNELDEKDWQKKLSYFDVLDEKNFGSITFLEAKPKEEFIKEEIQSADSQEIRQEKCIAGRLVNWYDLGEDKGYIFKKIDAYCGR